MQGCGNDFIFIDAEREIVEQRSALAVRICDRRFGVGADQMILISKDTAADFRMTVYNADGSEAEMCGNALRCVGKYVYSEQLTQKTDITVITASGIKSVKLNMRNGVIESVTADVGIPEFKSSVFPLNTEHDDFLGRDILIDGEAWNINVINVGNPHCVTFTDNVDTLVLPEIGPKFEHHALFPKRINTEFIQIIDKTTVKMRVWERGAGETLACGTGSCAAAVALMLKTGLYDSPVKVLLKGGELLIGWDKSSGRIRMTGGAEYVFKGDY